MIGIGLQGKTMDDLAKDLDILSSQLLGLFKKIIRKFVQNINIVLEDRDGKNIPVEKVTTMGQELKEQPSELENKEKKKLVNLSRTEDESAKVLAIKAKKNNFLLKR